MTKDFGYVVEKSSGLQARVWEAVVISHSISGAERGFLNAAVKICAEPAILSAALEPNGQYMGDMTWLRLRKVPFVEGDSVTVF